MQATLERLQVDNHFIQILYHFKNYFGANIARKAVGVIALPVMTRLLLPSEYGILSVFMSYAAILVVMLSLNSHTSIGRYWYEKKDDFNEFMGTSVCLVAAVLAASVLIFVAFRTSLSRMLSMDQSLVILLLPFVTINIVMSVFRQVYEPQRKSRLIAKFDVAYAYLGFGASVALVLMIQSERYYGVIWGQLLMGILVIGLMIRLLIPHFKLAFSHKHLRYILGYSTPLIPYALSGVILAQFDRVMINGYIGADAAGLYSLGYNIGMLLLLMNSALLAAWTPDYFEDMDNKDYRKLDADVDKIFRLILIGAMFLMLFGSDLGLILADRKYHVALGIVPVVVFGYVFDALFQVWGRNIGYARKTIWAPMISLIVGFSNILLNAIFIPRYGYVAGAYTTVASFMLMALMGWVVSKYVIHLHTTPMGIIVKPLCILLSVYALLIVIAQAGWGLWAMIGIKIVLFSMFCAAMVGRYIPGLFRSVTATEVK